MALRVTELANPLTLDIDIASTPALVRTLAASDAQLFTGYAGLPNVTSDEATAAAVRVVRAVASALRHPQGHVVFSGCGTSGRLSHTFARGLNAWVARAYGVDRKPFDYLLAGTDAALLLPQEQVEDQADAGVRDLDAWEHSHTLSHTHTSESPVVVIGISCGLSATYVSSMLNAAARRPNYTAVAMGFNPVEGVKGVAVDTCAHTFYDTLMTMMTSEAHHCVVLNPVVGPESIAGSSRMKGGSITKILSESICTAGVLMAYGGLFADASFPDTDANVAAFFRDCVAQYSLTVSHVYNQAESIAALVDKAAHALNTNVASKSAPEPAFVSPTGIGRIIYVGVGTAGVLGLIDASECNPTYGSLFNSVRGFIAGGFDTVAPRHPEETTNLLVPLHMRGDKHAASISTPETIGIDLDTFRTEWLPTITTADLVVLVYLSESTGAAVETQLRDAISAVRAAGEAGATTTFAAVVQAGDAAGEATLAELRTISSEGVVVRLPHTRLQADLTRTYPAPPHTVPSVAAAPSFLGELALKLVLNANTVGAHVRKGTIYRNRMINVMLTNAKLFHRAVGIVADVTGIPKELARTSVLRAIYHRDDHEVAGESPVRYSDEDLRLLAGTGAGAVVASSHAAMSFPDITALPVSAHVHNACSQLNVVPTAIMLAVNAMLIARAKANGGAAGVKMLGELEARTHLKNEPVIRKAISAALAQA